MAISFAVAMLLVATGIYVALHLRSSTRTNAPRELELTRINLSGNIEAANISPDGKYLASVQTKMGQQSLWLTQLATGRELQLVSLGESFCPGISFSPDGNYLYFVRMQSHAATGALYRIAILGGESGQALAGISGAPVISPDGRLIAFVRSTLSTHGVDSIVTTSIDGSNERVLASYAAPGVHFDRLAFSGDGRMLVYPVRDDLMAIPISGGSARVLPASMWTAIDDVSALPPGPDVVIVGELPGSTRSQLYLVPIAGGPARAITHDLSNYSSIRATSDGNTLMAVHRVQLSSIESVAPGRELEARRLTPETQNQIGSQGLAWTPDGRIVYSSESEHRVEITVVDRDGQHPSKIEDSTFVVTDLAMSPRGDLLAMARWSAGDIANLWLLDIKDGREQKLTDGQQDFPPSFTSNGRWIIYGSVRGDKPVLMKIAAGGEHPFS
jgi:Tol biopolymer transport system component